MFVETKPGLLGLNTIFSWLFNTDIVDIYSGDSVWNCTQQQQEDFFVVDSGSHRLVSKDLDLAGAIICFGDERWGNTSFCGRVILKTVMWR